MKSKLGKGVAQFALGKLIKCFCFQLCSIAHPVTTAVLFVLTRFRLWTHSASPLCFCVCSVWEREKHSGFIHLRSFYPLARPLFRHKQCVLLL